jgi:hypothetical protein
MKYITFLMSIIILLLVMAIYGLESNDKQGCGAVYNMTIAPQIHTIQPVVIATATPKIIIKRGKHNQPDNPVPNSVIVTPQQKPQQDNKPDPDSNGDTHSNNHHGHGEDGQNEHHSKP